MQSKRSRLSKLPLTFSQAVTALRLAKAQPWGDNLIWTAADCRNEARYMAVVDDTESYRITCRADIMAAIDYIAELDYEMDPEAWIVVLGRIRAFEEKANLPPAQLKMYRRQSAAALARLKKAA
jgi:hypothetical protein